MKKYINNSKKSSSIQKIINEALEILELSGIPMENKTDRTLERMAMSFLAVAGVTDSWMSARSDSSLKTRDIINFVNQHFEENISSGSYDDIRRKDLKLLVLAGLVVNTGGSATNDPTRGYSLHSDFKELILKYNTPQWQQALEVFNSSMKNLSDTLARKRNMDRLPVKLPNGVLLELSGGSHNVLQQKIVEEFLPRFGSDCKVLYIGDTSNKLLYVDDKKLQSLNFFELRHEELPDIIAYSSKNNWLYLIEAVHSSGTMSETRMLELKDMLRNCSAELIFVTAFLTK